MDAALIELLFSFGIILALACWELWRTPRPDRDDADESEPAGDARHPKRQ
jgi:ABC-type nickel/cobalt efflux system permease component RcnA